MSLTKNSKFIFGMMMAAGVGLSVIFSGSVAEAEGGMGININSSDKKIVRKSKVGVSEATKRAPVSTADSSVAETAVTPAEKSNSLSDILKERTGASAASGSSDCIGAAQLAGGIAANQVDIEQIEKIIKADAYAATALQPVADWFASCREDALTKIRSCYSGMATALSGVNSTLMAKCTSIQNRGMDIGGFKKAKLGREGFGESADKINSAKRICSTEVGISIKSTGAFEPSSAAGPEANKCEVACSMERLNTIIAEAEVSETKPTPAEVDSWRVDGTALESACYTHRNHVLTNFNTAEASARALESGASGTQNLFLMGGAAAVGGAILYNKKKSDDKKDDEKKDKKKAQKEFDEGIARDTENEKVNCLLPETFANAECKPVLLSYCAKPENTSKAGCDAFRSNYCNDADAPVAYCLASSSKSYCGQAEPGIDKTKSPSCVWMTGRPSTCLKNSEDIQCLTKLTPQQLDSICENFLSDPLCQAHLSGKVVTQPVGSAYTFDSASSSSNGLNDLVAPSASGNTSLLGSQAMTYQQLCESGQLTCE